MHTKFNEYSIFYLVFAIYYFWKKIEYSIFMHSSHDYKRLFRFDENNVNWIVRNVLMDNIEVETRGGALSTKQQL